MSKEREALKLALEALEFVNKSDDDCDFMNFECAARVEDAITAIKEALMSQSDGAQPAVPQGHKQEPTYTSTQATMCAGCGEHKHTPLRIDAMGGYVCLTCIDQKLGSLLGEFGYAQPEQEPVAYLVYDHGAESQYLAFDDELGDMDGCEVTSLYTTPPQRTWVKLTDEEIVQCQQGNIYHFYRCIEAKLKEKNT